MSLVFTLRMAGAQQLLPGLMLAALAGGLAGRWLMAVPIYRALGEQAHKDQTDSVPHLANAIAGSDQ
jgi:H+/Cl- antiporter ClcA